MSTLIGSCDEWLSATANRYEFICRISFQNAVRPRYSDNSSVSSLTGLIEAVIFNACHFVPSAPISGKLFPSAEMRAGLAPVICWIQHHASFSSAIKRRDQFALISLRRKGGPVISTQSKYSLVLNFSYIFNLWVS